MRSFADVEKVLRYFRLVYSRNFLRVGASGSRTLLHTDILVVRDRSKHLLPKNPLDPGETEDSSSRATLSI